MGGGRGEGMGGGEVGVRRVRIRMNYGGESWGVCMGGGSFCYSTVLDAARCSPEAARFYLVQKGHELYKDAALYWSSNREEREAFRFWGLVDLGARLAGLADFFFLDEDGAERRRYDTNLLYPFQHTLLPLDVLEGLGLTPENVGELLLLPSAPRLKMLGRWIFSVLTYLADLLADPAAPFTQALKTQHQQTIATVATAWMAERSPTDPAQSYLSFELHLVDDDDHISPTDHTEPALVIVLARLFLLADFGPTATGASVWAAGLARKTARKLKTEALALFAYGGDDWDDEPAGHRQSPWLTDKGDDWEGASRLRCQLWADECLNIVDTGEVIILRPITPTLGYTKALTQCRFVASLRPQRRRLATFRGRGAIWTSTLFGCCVCERWSGWRTSPGRVCMDPCPGERVLGWFVALCVWGVVQPILGVKRMGVNTYCVAEKKLRELSSVGRASGGPVPLFVSEKRIWSERAQRQVVLRKTTAWVVAMIKRGDLLRSEDWYFTGPAVPADWYFVQRSGLGFPLTSLRRSNHGATDSGDDEIAAMIRRRQR